MRITKKEGKKRITLHFICPICSEEWETDGWSKKQYYWGGYTARSACHNCSEGLAETDYINEYEYEKNT